MEEKNLERGEGKNNGNLDKTTMVLKIRYSREDSYDLAPRPPTFPSVNSTDDTQEDF